MTIRYALCVIVYIAIDIVAKTANSYVKNFPGLNPS